MKRTKFRQCNDNDNDDDDDDVSARESTNREKHNTVSTMKLHDQHLRSALYASPNIWHR